jgi:hypothetical protein
MAEQRPSEQVSLRTETGVFVPLSHWNNLQIELRLLRKGAVRRTYQFPQEIFLNACSTFIERIPQVQGDDSCHYCGFTRGEHP